jgi:hypothetical protein
MQERLQLSGTDADEAFGGAGETLRSQAGGRSEMSEMYDKRTPRPAQLNSAKDFRTGEGRIIKYCPVQ